MTREMTAGAVLVLILALLIVNVKVFDAKSESLYRKIDEAQALAEAGNPEAASRAAASATGEWLDWGGHIHILLRHSEAEGVTEAFFDLLRSMESEGGAGSADFDRLRQCIKSVMDCEHFSLQSVF